MPPLPPPTMFENDQLCVSLDTVTWVEKKRDGAVNVHFPGADVILMNKSYGPAFLEAYYRFHQWRSGGRPQAGQQALAAAQQAAAAQPSQQAATSSQQARPAQPQPPQQA